ncbi:MAG TPA: hypothetical protein VER33_10505 [Polyangiaceae bacterium]|nr:hypothetical protein [Ardenticatenaceae bacterium]HYO94934.1 hypothetical protein [Polyangiaceae bacterium]
MQAVKGMVQVAGTTYRIVRVGQGLYDIVRILDDARVGSFRSSPRIEVTSYGMELGMMREIARAAIQGAKTSWVGRLALP